MRALSTWALLAWRSMLVSSHHDRRQDAEKMMVVVVPERPALSTCTLLAVVSEKMSLNVGAQMCDREILVMCFSFKVLPRVTSFQCPSATFPLEQCWGCVTCFGEWHCALCMCRCCSTSAFDCNAQTMNCSGNSWH